MPGREAGLTAADRPAGTGRLVPAPPLREAPLERLAAERLVLAERPEVEERLERLVAVLLRRVVVTAEERRVVEERLVLAGRAFAAGVGVAAAFTGVAGVAAGLLAAAATGAAAAGVGVAAAAVGGAAGAAGAGLVPEGVLELAMGGAGGGGAEGSGTTERQVPGITHPAPRNQ
jgi:hypothetical protein